MVYPWMLHNNHQHLQISSLNCEDCKRKGLCGLERDEDAVDSDFEDTENLDPVVCEAVIDEVATL